MPAAEVTTTSPPALSVVTALPPGSVAAASVTFAASSKISSPADSAAASIAPFADAITMSAPLPSPTPIVKLGLPDRSEEHTSELQSLMRISYAVFCLKKKIHTQHSYPQTLHE